MSMKSFPRPSDLPIPTGAEGWEKIYPDYLVFQDSLKEIEDEKFWFCDSQHWPTVFKPFETIGGEFAVKCLGQYNARHLMIPNANGIDFRIHQGYLYMSPIPVPEDQIEARLPEFQARIGHYFANWEPLLEQWKTKVRGTIDEIEALDFSKLPDMVPMDDILSGKAKDGSERLLENFDRLIQLAYQNWQYHFEFLNLGYIAYLDFFNYCKEIFPDIPDQSIATMVQGVDMELFRPDDELKQLATTAVELGLQSAFDNTDDAEATLQAIAEADGGTAWLAQWEKAQDPWFNFTTGNGFYAHDEYWKENFSIPLGFIADYIRRLDEGQTIMRPTEALIEEKERIVSEYRDLLDDEQGRPSKPNGSWPPPPTRTWRTTTSTSSTGRWECSGARSANSPPPSSNTESSPKPVTSSTSTATKSGTSSSTSSPNGVWVLHRGRSPRPTGRRSSKSARRSSQHSRPLVRSQH